MIHSTAHTESTPMVGAAPPKTARVLVVDDDVALRAFTCAILKSLGLESVSVNTGEEAIETFQASQENGEPISAIIMDLALPGGMSGLETTDHLRAIDPKISVIASSGYLQQSARAAAIERGFAGILPKPFTAERFSTELRWVLQRK